MKTKQKSFFKHIDFLILDVILIEVAYMAAFFLRLGTWDLGSQISVYETLLILFPILEILYIVFTDGYHNILKRDAFSEFKYVMANSLVLWGMIIAFLFLIKQAEFFSRNISVVGFLFTTVFIYVGHLLLKQVIRKKKNNSYKQSQLLLVTTADHMPQIVTRFAERKYNGFSLAGIYLVHHDETLHAEYSEYPIIHESMEEFLLNHVVDDVMISLPDECEAKQAMIRNSINAGTRVHISLEDIYNDLPNCYVEKYGGYSVVTTGISDASPVLLAMKRVMDIVGSLVGLLICGIAYIFVAPAIYKASPGPIFFGQTRVGKNGRTFTCYKFRSMYPDAEERKKELMKHNKMSGGMFKMDNDPRIIGSEKGPGKGIGNFIRKTSIDELPQFWNVLRGNMSLVGIRDIIRATRRNPYFQVAHAA